MHWHLGSLLQQRLIFACITVWCGLGSNPWNFTPNGDSGFRILPSCDAAILTTWPSRLLMKGKNSTQLKAVILSGLGVVYFIYQHWPDPSDLNLAAREAGKCSFPDCLGRRSILGALVIPSLYLCRVEDKWLAWETPPASLPCLSASFKRGSIIAYVGHNSQHDEHSSVLSI